MRNKRIWALATGALLILLVSATALAATPRMNRAPVIHDETVIWELSKARVVDPGRTYAMGEGTMTEGFVIEAKAKAKHNNVVPEGRFQLTLSAFAPNRDMPGQKAGTWYVQGKWVITKAGADPNVLKARHNPAKVEGTVSAELGFNPTTSPDKWSGKARIPMSLAAGQWAKGEGALSLDGNFEGDLFLPLELWAKGQ